MRFICQGFLEERIVDKNKRIGGKESGMTHKPANIHSHMHTNTQENTGNKNEDDKRIGEGPSSKKKQVYNINFNIISYDNGTIVRLKISSWPT